MTTASGPYESHERGEYVRGLGWACVSWIHGGAAERVAGPHEPPPDRQALLARIDRLQAQAGSAHEKPTP